MKIFTKISLSVTFLALLSVVVVPIGSENIFLAQTQANQPKPKDHAAIIQKLNKQVASLKKEQKLNKKLIQNLGNLSKEIVQILDILSKKNTHSLNNEKSAKIIAKALILSAEIQKKSTEKIANALQNISDAIRQK